MSDTERVDHGDAIKRHAHRVRGLADALTEHAEPITMAAFGNIEDATTAIERHADALAAELAGAIADSRGDMEDEPELARLYALLTDDGIPYAVKALVRSNLAITASQLEAWT